MTPTDMLICFQPLAYEALGYLRRHEQPELLALYTQCLHREPAGQSMVMMTRDIFQLVHTASSYYASMCDVLLEDLYERVFNGTQRIYLAHTADILQEDTTVSESVLEELLYQCRSTGTNDGLWQIVHSAQLSNDIMFRVLNKLVARGNCGDLECLRWNTLHSEEEEDKDEDKDEDNDNDKEEDKDVELEDDEETKEDVSNPRDDESPEKQEDSICGEEIAGSIEVEEPVEWISIESAVKEAVPPKRKRWWSRLCKRILKN
jgi:hypothetical protein